MREFLYQSTVQPGASLHRHFMCILSPQSRNRIELSDFIFRFQNCLSCLHPSFRQLVLFKITIINPPSYRVAQKCNSVYVNTGCSKEKELQNAARAMVRSLNHQQPAPLVSGNRCFFLIMEAVQKTGCLTVTINDIKCGMNIK